MVRASIVAAAATAFSLFAVGQASADLIPYPGGGENVATYTFTALQAGDVKAYFYGTDAGFDSEIGILVNNVTQNNGGVWHLPNHSTAIGTSATIAVGVNIGDVLVFTLNVNNGHNIWYSDKSLNSDGAQHIYSTLFTGAGGVYAAIPVGTYIGWEDLSKTNEGPDWDYNDHEFVFTLNNQAIGAPGPIVGAGLPGLLAACGGLLALARRRRQKIV